MTSSDLSNALISIKTKNIKEFKRTKLKVPTYLSQKKNLLSAFENQGLDMSRHIQQFPLSREKRARERECGKMFFFILIGAASA